MTRYIVYSRINLIEEKFDHKWVRGVGEHAVFQQVPLGYFMFLDGSHEGIHIGIEKPSFQIGDRIKITFERT